MNSNDVTHDNRAPKLPKVPRMALAAITTKLTGKTIFEGIDKTIGNAIAQPGGVGLCKGTPQRTAWRWAGQHNVALACRRTKTFTPAAGPLKAAEVSKVPAEKSCTLSPWRAKLALIKNDFFKLTVFAERGNRPYG